MNGRNLTAGVDAALAASQVRAVVFIEMDFPSGFLRLNNSSQPLPWNGFTWLGAGRVGAIEQIAEGSSLEARGLNFSISGIAPEHVATALAQQYQGRSCKVWLAPLLPEYTTIPDPVVIFHGRMDVMDIELGETANITVSAESRLADWDRPRIRRYTAADQKLTDPDDKGLDFVPQMVEKELRWGY